MYIYLLPLESSSPPPHPTFTMHSTKARGMDTSPVSLTNSVLCFRALV